MARRCQSALALIVLVCCGGCAQLPTAPKAAHHTPIQRVDAIELAYDSTFRWSGVSQGRLAGAVRSAFLTGFATAGVGVLLNTGGSYLSNAEVALPLMLFGGAIGAVSGFFRADPYPETRSQMQVVEQAVADAPTLWRQAMGEDDQPMSASQTSRQDRSVVIIRFDQLTAAARTWSAKNDLRFKLKMRIEAKIKDDHGNASTEIRVFESASQPLASWALNRPGVEAALKDLGQQVRRYIDARYRLDPP